MTWPEGVSHATLLALVRQSLQAGTRPWLTVTSGSMRPLLQVGDEVEVAAVSLDDLLPGDVLVLDEGESFLTHRLRHIRDDFLHTRGDRLLRFDPPFRTTQLVGRVTAVRRGDSPRPFTPRLNRAVHQLMLAEEKRVACLRQPQRPPGWLDRVWHRLYFYRVQWLLARHSP